MKLYCGIDLHANNHYICVIDEKDKRLLEVKCDNDIAVTIKSLSKYKRRLQGIAVESTFNWYWLVDGLMDAGFKVNLVNTTKVVQYNGLKRTNDRYDAFHLAHLMRLGILPTGYIYPKETRGLRDLSRKRMQLVQNRSSHVIRYKSNLYNLTGRTERADRIKTNKYKAPEIADPAVQMALQCHLQMIRTYSAQIKAMEKRLLFEMKSRPEIGYLKTSPGIGDILALTIVLETGNIERFKGPGNYASYCRCVDSRRESNGKKKGENNRKNGNRYLAWAFIEAANFAIRHSEKAKGYYQKKAKKTNKIVALKALAHKLARACYWMMKKQQAFDETLIFS